MRRPRHIGISRRVHSDGETKVGPAPAEVGRVNQSWINNQRLRLIVVGNFKMNAVVGGEDVSAIKKVTRGE